MMTEKISQGPMSEKRCKILLTLGKKNQRKFRPASQDGSPRIMLASRAQKALKEKKRILFDANQRLLYVCDEEQLRTLR